MNIVLSRELWQSRSSDQSVFGYCRVTLPELNTGISDVEGKGASFFDKKPSRICQAGRVALLRRYAVLLMHGQADIVICSSASNHSP